MSTISFDFPTSEHSSNPEVNSWEREWSLVKNVFIDYVQPDSTLSLDDALTQIMKFWNPIRKRFLNTVLSIPHILAEQIPYDHPSHGKLAKFMLALHDSAKWVPEDKSPEERVNEQDLFWKSLCANMNDDEWPPEYNVEEDGDPWQYTNICAFVAQLIFPKQQPHRFCYRRARTALADIAELDSTFPVEVREARLAAAAQYIIYQVSVIFDEVIKERKLEEEREKASIWRSKLVHREREPRHSPEAEFCWEDWQAWEREFFNAAANEKLGRKCRDIAQRAVDLMFLQRSRMIAR